MTNTEFAKTNKEFLKACKAIIHLKEYQDFKPSTFSTTRQASKWRMKKGIAWKVAQGCLTNG